MNQSVWNNRKLEEEEGKATRWWSSRPFLLVVLAIATVVGLTVFWSSVISSAEGEGDEANIPIVAAESIDVKEEPEVVGGKMAHSDKAVYELISKNTHEGTTVHLKSSEEAPLQETSFDQASIQPMAEEMVVVEEVSASPERRESLGEAMPGNFKVQVGSLPSQSLAEKQWKRVKHKYAEALSGVKGSIVAKNIPGKGTFYRIYLGGFDTKEDARVLCDKLTSQGLSCLVVG